MDALRAVSHVVVRLARRIVHLVMLARSRQLRQFVIDRSGFSRICRGLCPTLNWIKGQRRRAGERARHHSYRSEHVWSYQGAVCGHGRAGVASNHRGGAVAEGGYQSEGIPHQIGMAKRKYIAVIRVILTCRATIASHVRSEHVKACRSQRQHDLAPTVCDLGISMEEEEARPFLGLEAGFQYVESETVDIGHVVGANAGGKRERSKFRRVGLNDCGARDLRLDECAGSCCGGGQNEATSGRARRGLSATGCVETWFRLHGHVERPH